MGERVQGGRLVARAIAAHGVDAIFTLSGGHVMPIYEGCRHEGVRVVDVRHEQAAAHAAEAWGRICRSCGVAVVTAGPGVTGTVTAVANCRVAQTPLLVVGGARPLVQAEQGALQELDQLSLFKPITKWATRIYDARRIPELVATAYRQATTGKPGPVYIDMPGDVLGETVDESTITYPKPWAQAPRTHGDPGAISEAIALCRDGLRRVPHYTTARLILAKTLLAGGDLVAAESELDAILAGSPNDAECHRLLAEVHRRRGDLPASVRHLETAVGLDPGDRDAQTALRLLRGAPGGVPEGGLGRALRDDVFATATFGPPASPSPAPPSPTATRRATSPSAIRMRAPRRPASPPAAPTCAWRTAARRPTGSCRRAPACRNRWSCTRCRCRAT